MDRNEHMDWARIAVASLVARLVRLLKLGVVL